MNHSVPLRALLEKPFVVLGIVNVTPDSFFDGGKYDATDKAIEHGMSLSADGADVLDIGGESTRPGASVVTADEECRRILPVIEALARRTAVPISVDTTKASVALRAFDAGASWINDVSAGRFDPGMPGAAAWAFVPAYSHAQQEDSPKHAGTAALQRRYCRSKAGAACLGRYV